VSEIKDRLIAPRARLLVFGLAVVMAPALAALLLHHFPDGVFGHIQAIAAWLKGGPKPEVVTWPAWGYAWLITVIPSFGVVAVFQTCVGALALTALAGRLWNQMPRYWTLSACLLLLAVPWHNQQIELYPSALAGSLTLISLLCLDTAIYKKAGRYAVYAGIFAGVAQNFRTEFVLLPLFIGICIVGLRCLGIMRFPAFKPVLVFIITAFALQLPWAAFYHSQTGRFSLTESNLGHVLYVSLGSEPRNPWHIKGDDQSAGEAVRNAGYPQSSLSEEGNQFLKHLVFNKVKEHPCGLVQRTLQQMKNTFLAPFNWGEPGLDKQSLLDLDVLREELKSRLGAGVNVRELQDYRTRGLYPAAKRNMAAIGALVYQFCAVGLGGLVMILGIVGMVLVLVNPALRPAAPLIYLLGA